MTLSSHHLPPAGSRSTGAALSLAVGLVVLAGCSSAVPVPSHSDPLPLSSAPESVTLQTQTRYEDGAPVGRTATREQVPVGTPVTLVVTGDRPEQIHLRSYERYADVPGPEASGQIDFVADTPGVVVLELERTGVPLVEITVTVPPSAPLAPTR